MIKISEKVDKQKTYNGFSGDISFFIHGRTSSEVVSVCKCFCFSKYSSGLFTILKS